MIRNELTASKTPFSSLDAILDASRRLDEMKREKAKNAGDELLAWYQETTPSYTWTWPWQRMVFDHLRKIQTGEIKKLLIEIPPRHGKSMLVTVRFPIFMLEKHPGFRVAVGGHGQKFAQKLGKMARMVARDREIKLSYESRSAREWETANGGVFRSFGIGSPPTGEGFNGLILDDVIRDKAQAYSPAHRENVWDSYVSDIQTRLEPNAWTIFIMHRWHHCLHPDTIILTDHGSVRADSVLANQTVITSQGPQRVIATASRYHSGEMVIIRSMGYPHPIKVTPEHRILTSMGWKEAKDITKNDTLMLPCPQGADTNLDDIRKMIPEIAVAKKRQITAKKATVTKERLEELLATGKTQAEIGAILGFKGRLSVDRYMCIYGLTRYTGNRLKGDPVSNPRFWRMVGYWLAEGCLTETRKGKPKSIVRFTFGWSEQHLVDEVRETMASHGIKSSVVCHRLPGKLIPHAMTIKFSSKEIAGFLETFGMGAWNKKLPEWAVMLPDELAKELLIGYWIGDGTIDADGLIRIGSVSRDLIEGFRRLCLRMGIRASIMANWRAVSNDFAHELRFHSSEAPWMGLNHKPLRSRRSYLAHGWLYSPVKSVEREQYDGMVYDLQTPAGDFLAHGMTVHNCDVVGMLEKSDDWPNWTVLKFPALAEENDPLGREVGEALCPERYSEAAIRNVAKTMTSFDFSARYQQRAIPIEGAHFRREWFKQCVIEGEHYVFSDGSVEVRNNLTVALYVDPALGKKGSDNTGIMAVAFAPSGRMIVLEAVNRRIPIAKLPNEVARIANQWGADWVSMEANGFQIETMSRLRADHPHLACRELQPGIKNKLARAQRAIVLAEQGNIYLSDYGEFQEDFLIELTSFTGSGDESDALVDTLAYSAQDQHQFVYDEESKPKSSGGMERLTKVPGRNLNRGRGGNVWRQF